MCLDSIYSDTFDMPIACYRKLKTGGTTCPTSNHYLADPEPMALLLQPVDHVSPNRPSPCAT